MSGAKLHWFVFLAFCVSLVIILSSCVSSKRMMKNSPFESDSLEDTAKSSFKGTFQGSKKYQKDEPFLLDVNKERINWWPFLYQHPEFTSVLWPMADFDKNGVAVRPFYVQDKNEYAIMFPLSAWNPVNGDGWIFTGYWDKDCNGLFPFYHLGEDFNYVLPVWWTKKYWGGPVWGFARDKGLNMAGPFWYNSKSGRFGFFPLMWHKNINKGAFFPLYYYRVNDDGDLILPLFGALGHYYRSDADSSLMVVNYCHSNFSDGKTVNDMFLPLYIYRKVDDRTYFLSPLFAFMSETGNNTGFANILGPLFFRYWKGKERKTNILFPFIGYEYSPDESVSYVFPFFVKMEDKKKSWLWILPYYRERDIEGKEKIEAVLPFYRYSKSPDLKSLWIFPWYQDEEKNGANCVGIFPLAFYTSKAKDWKVVLPGLLSSFSNRETNFLVPFGRYEYGESFRFWPLIAVNEDFPSPIINITKRSICLLVGIGLYYGHEKDEYSEDSLVSSLLFLGSKRKRELKLNLEDDFIADPKIGNMELELDYYLLYYRSKKKSRLWDYSKIDRGEVKKAVKLWRNFYYSQRNIKSMEYWIDYKNDTKNKEPVIDIPDEKKTDEELEEKQRYADDLKKLEKKKNNNLKLKAELTGILEKHGIPVKENNSKALEKGLVEFMQKYSRTEEKGWQLMFPFYYSSFQDGESNWYFMLFLANGKSGKDYSSFRVLRYFYRQQFQKDKYNYDIFPFINVHGSKDFYKYSFGWRLFSMRKDKKTGERSGHICFIPY